MISNVAFILTYYVSASTHSFWSLAHAVLSRAGEWQESARAVP